uniref:Uncharacterized protein n=1 Tax=Craspedostauros australis TaxID=1486917 RepID=A0A7R9ZLK1_9STRA|mmetsp:Transcript_20649/g.57373  ORF Transcript_20649/g.57373 Transcript_20649/m.57373 type:complete len:212 (+) Transcript_20649:315-950(+)
MSASVPTIADASVAQGAIPHHRHHNAGVPLQLPPSPSPTNTTATTLAPAQMSTTVVHTPTKPHVASPTSHTTMLYQRAILKAIEELNDWQSRSSVDAIRRHVEAQFMHDFHDIVFLKTIKNMMHNGDLHMDAQLCEASDQWKRKRAQALVTKATQQAPSRLHGHNTRPDSLHPRQHLQPAMQQHEPKDSPKRRAEHAKIKIIPKRIYDKQL